jgi:uncharacterized protein
MLFNVSVLLREPVGSTRRYTLEPEPPVLNGEVLLTLVPKGILVRCNAEVTIEDRCSRCLAPFGYSERIAFEEIFLQQVDVQTGARLDEQGPTESFAIATNHTIDITEAVRQYTEMAAAMQPLCRPDCPGICPECGTDLTVGSCTCSRSPIDSRWGALAALKFSANG